MIEKMGEEKWQFTKLLEKCIDENDDGLIDPKKLRASSIASLNIVDYTKSMLNGKGLKKKELSKRIALIFGVGHGVHHWIQSQIIYKKKGIFAKWVCPICKNVMYGVDLEFCTKCKSKSSEGMQFHEPDLDINVDGYSLGGHPDLIKIIMGDKPYAAIITDIKTINSMNFDNLKTKGPNLGYVIQVIVYMYLLEKYIENLKVKTLSSFALGDPMLDVNRIFGRIYYINKNDSSEMEFGVRRNQKVIDCCLESFNFYRQSMIAGEINKAVDLDVMNKTIIDRVGEDELTEAWYPL